jgi:hypothetical protein
MKTTMVRYKLKADAGQENEKLVREVFAQIAREKPAGVRYQVFKMADGVSWVHLASSEAEVNPITFMNAFKQYVAQIKDRCEEQPVFAQLQVVGLYDGMA